MKLYTSHYRAWRPGRGSPVVTSLLVPKWLPETQSWPRLWAATPRWAYFHAEPDEFDRQFIAQLERYGARRIAAKLAEIARDAYQAPAGTLILHCWEHSPGRCHRGIFARWWLENTGEVIPELPCEPSGQFLSSDQPL